MAAEQADDRARRERGRRRPRRGRARRRASRPRAAASACSSSGRWREIEPRARRRGRRRARLDREGAPTRRAPSARRPRPRSCRRSGRSRPATPTRSSPAARPAPRSPPGCSTSSARAASTGPALAVARARARRARSCCSTAARTSRCGPSTSSSSRTWARRSWRRCWAWSARASRCSPTAPSRPGAPRTCRPRTRRSAAQPGLNFTGNVEGFAIGTGEADVIVTDGFTGNVVPEGHGGDRGHAAARRARGGALDPARQGAAGCCSSRRWAGCATRSTPRRRAAPSCWACASWASCRTARSARAASRGRSTWPRAGRATGVVERTHERLAAAGALRRAAGEPSEPAATVPDS